ncbi:DUF4270 family protein [Carboxylicivirga taeanensis]|uniref:DUF4270 family protein n=1 Tax=Carboxylicivirga taeanensis TaxID=1416875 RepID=UPI003F6DBE70
MHRHPQTNLLYLPLVLLLLFGLNACQEGELDLSDDFISFPSYTALVDTVTIQLSTFKEDSVITSGTGAALVGYYQHPILGGQEAKSYFALNAPPDFNWDNNKQIYDSLVMVLRVNTYSIGDTSTNVSYSAHRLTQTISASSDEALYNTSQFGYEPEPIAQTSFRLFPHEDKYLRMRINDTFANELIDFLNANSQHSEKDKLFNEQFKGLVLQSDTNISRAVAGYEVNDTACYLRMYSHLTGLEPTNIINNFSLSHSSNQFNQLTSHNTSVIFNQLSSKKHVVNAQESGHVALLQAGSGLKLRIDFPSLNNLQELKQHGYIIKAEMRLKPNMHLMKTSDLPTKIYFGDIYRANEIWGYLSDSEGNPLGAQLTIDKMYGENTYYTVDLTSYLSNRLNEEVIDTDLGLVVSLHDDVLGNTYSWLAINGQSASTNASQLLLYYYYYDIK